MTSDPIGLNGGVNTYGYVRGNPLKFIDIFGLDSLLFNGAYMSILDNNGKTISSYPATSGLPGTTPADAGIPFTGPLPEGQYSVDPSKTDNFNWYDPRDFDWWSKPDRIAWGNIRTPIDGSAQGRSGFFLHGGKDAGSAGCIDLTSKNTDFHKALSKYKIPLPLTVKYAPWLNMSDDEYNKWLDSQGE